MKRHVLTLLALLAVFLIYHMDRSAPKPEPPKRTLLFPSLDQNAVDTLILHLPKEEVRLARSGTRWVLPEWNNHPAEQHFVKGLLNTLVKAPAGLVVADNLEKRPAFGLDDSATRVVLYGKDQILAELLVGKPTDNYRGAYVHLPQENSVRLVMADLIPNLHRPTWCDRTVWRMLPRLITEVRTSGFPHDLNAQKDEAGQWHARSGTLSPSFTEELLPLLAHLRSGNATRLEGSFSATCQVTIVAATAEMTLYLDTRDQVMTGAREHGPVLYHFDRQLANLIEKALITD